MVIQESERSLQRKVHSFLSDPSKIWTTIQGKDIQILTCGTINVYEGPDFVDIAIIDGSTIVVGHAEFHRKSSDFLAHNHQVDQRYQHLCLHIVFENDSENSFAEHTLVLNKDQVLSNGTSENEVKENIEDLEDIQHFSLKRLLRKSSEAKKIIDSAATVEIAISHIIVQFLERFLQKRTRPRQFTESLEELSNLCSLQICERLLPLLHSDKEGNIPSVLLELGQKYLPVHGAHLGREIVLNCVLPIALCIGNDFARIQLFTWYWSTNSLHSYGFLKRKYPHISQNYLWQQQGLLEYNSYFGPKKTGVAELLSTYSVAETLSFYRLAIIPIDTIGQMREDQI